MYINQQLAQNLKLLDCGPTIYIKLDNTLHVSSINWRNKQQKSSNPCPPKTKL